MGLTGDSPSIAGIAPVVVAPAAAALSFNGLAPAITGQRPTPLNLTNTFNFAPSLGEIVLYCFARLGVTRPEVTVRHLSDARIAANMVLSDWSNEQVNLWEVDLQSVQLTAGQSTYPVPPETVLILDAYIRLNATSSQPIDLILYPISRTEWASLPDKSIPGRPTTFWFDRLIAPSITLWQPPDSSTTYTLQYYRVRQMMDASVGGATNVEVPYRFLRAYADALTVELAHIYAPARVVEMQAAADRSWTKAQKRDAEDVPLFVVPGMSGYYRQQ